MSEIDKHLEEYARAFGDGFPMYQLGRGGTTDEEVIEIIKRCLSEKKDVYALGILKDDDTDY